MNENISMRRKKMANNPEPSELTAEEKKYYLIRNIILVAITITIILLVIILGQYFRITGYITSSVSLAKTAYSPGEAFEGNTSLTINVNDLIPAATTISLQIWNGSIKIRESSMSLTDFISNSNYPSSYWFGYGYFNDVNTAREWEGLTGYGFKYANAGSNATGTYTVDITKFNLTAPSSGDYTLKLNAIYDATGETVTASEEYLFSVSSFFMTSCQNITISGTYVLQNDILDSPEGICITVDADNVVIDCQGYAIDGIGQKPSFAILGKGKNLAIKNCTTTDWVV